MLLGNYLTTAWRNILRHKLFSIINILGLAIGLAAVMLITLFVRYELSFDTFWENADNIYRVHSHYDTPGQDPESLVLSSPPTVEAMAKDYPQITRFARLNTRDRTVTFGDNVFQDEITIADKAVLEIFNFEAIAGNLPTALDDNNGLVLTETIATKYFGSENPIGRVLTIETPDLTKDYQVNAVIEDLPKNSKIGFKILVPVVIDELEFFKFWFSTSVQAYFMVEPGTNMGAIEDTLVPFVDRNFPPLPFGDGSLKVSNVVTVTIMNMKDLHLYAKGIGDWWVPPGDIVTVTIFIVVAVLILLIASINFMNLSTARASRRAQEVSIRKVMGAKREHLIIQFLGESILMSVIALVVAIFFVEISLPLYNSIISKQLVIDYASLDLFKIVGLAMLVGLLAGIYPAFVLSSYRPAHILNSNQSSDNKSSLKFRAILVITQFTISIILFVSTLVIYNQMKFTEDMDIGYQPKNLVTVFGNNPNVLAPKIDIVQRRIQSIDGVQSVSWTANFAPGSQGSSLDPIRTEQTGDTKHILISYRGVGYDFLKTYAIPLIAGRDFDRNRNDERATNEEIIAGKGHMAGLILNQSAIQHLGLGTPEEALGKILYMNVGNTGLSEGNSVLEAEFSVIGVVPDVHLQDLKVTVAPEFFQLKTDSPFFVNLRIKGDPIGILEIVKSIWLEEMPTNSFNIEYADERLGQQYAQERGEMTMFASFSFLAIFIACLGLFGLASFTAERRKKEIGIRKVMGANTWQIVKLLVWQFSKPVLIANIIAWPVAYLAMSRWLESFVYRIDGTVIIALCLIAGLAALLIAWATVAGNSYAVARQNPIKALRYE